MDGMRTVDKLSDQELQFAYVVACNSYNSAYKSKKEIEEEFYRRFKIELEKNHI